MESLWNERKECTLRPAFGESPAVVITLKPVGASDDGKHDKAAWTRLQAAWMRANDKARIVARKQLIAEYGSLDEASDALLPEEKKKGPTAVVDYWVVRTDEYAESFSERVQNLILLGTVGGESTIHMLYKAGGDDLMKAGAAAVLQFNKVGAELGEV